MQVFIKGAFWVGVLKSYNNLVGPFNLKKMSFR